MKEDKQTFNHETWTTVLNDFPHSGAFKHLCHRMSGIMAPHCFALLVKIYSSNRRYAQQLTFILHALGEGINDFRIYTIQHRTAHIYTCIIHLMNGSYPHLCTAYVTEFWSHGPIKNYPAQWCYVYWLIYASIGLNVLITSQGCIQLCNC